MRPELIHSQQKTKRLMKTTNFKPTEKLVLLAAIPLMMMALLSCVSEDPELMGNKDNVLDNILHLSNEEIFDVVETMPRPPGGMEGWTRYLNENLIYPAEAKRAGILLLAKMVIS